MSQKEMKIIDLPSQRFYREQFKKLRADRSKHAFTYLYLRLKNIETAKLLQSLQRAYLPMK
jgi:hypothetical protein